MDGALRAFAAWAPRDRRSSSRYVEWRASQQPDAPSLPTIVRSCGAGWADARRRIAILLGEDDDGGVERPVVSAVAASDGDAEDPVQLAEWNARAVRERVRAAPGIDPAMAAALRAAADGGALGRKGYAAWRRTSDTTAPHPLAIVKAAGSWDAAVASAGIRPASVGRVARWTDDELVAAVREVAARIRDDAVLISAQYDAWHAEDPVNRPSSKQVWRRFVGWEPALVRCGLRVPEPGTSALATPRGAMLDALRDASVALGRPPRGAEYDAWAVAQSPPRPRTQTISKRLGGWAAALSAAGLDPEAVTAKRVRRPVVSADACGAALRAWTATLQPGASTSKVAYERWRQAQDSAWPSVGPIIGRFGGWAAALRAALPVRS